MKRSMFLFTVVTISASLFVAGCTVGTSEKPAKDSTAGKGKSPSTSDDARIQTALAKLAPEDRKLAEAQKWCAVEDENPLGGMGAPVQVLVNGAPVFLCCKGCQKRALADADKTLAKVAELKTKAGAAASP